MINVKELRGMKRQELLELLLEVTEENEKLKNKLQMLENQLASKEFAISKAGSIADASLQLSGIFNAAQDSADIYLFNLKKKNEKADEILRTAEQKAAQMKACSEQEAAELLDLAKRQAQELKDQAEQEIQQMVFQAKEKVKSIMQIENTLKEKTKNQL